jgi:hypothetical protein
MSVDAGSVNAEVRIRLDKLSGDIKAAGTAFDNLGTEFKESAEKYSTNAGQRYTNTLKTIAKEIANVEGAQKAGAISESQAVDRLIERRQQELRVLQDKAVKEGTASKETVSAIKKTEDALGLLVEKQKLLGSQGSGSIFDTFAKMRDVMLGPIGAFKEVASVIGEVMSKANELENEWAKQEDALAILNSVLKSTGAESWTSMDHLTGMAASLQKVTTYGDETIESMQGVLLGFRNIKGDNFDEASKAVLDMATVMKMDLTAAAQAVGKALDNPALGLDSLSKQGFKFTQQEKDMMAAMQAAGNIAGAQRIILDELSKTFGGASEAVGETATGLKSRLKNAIGDVNEEIGRTIANGLTPFRKWWLSIAESVGAAAKAQNDFKDAMDKAQKGTAGVSELATQEAKLVVQISAAQKAYDNFAAITAYDHNMTKKQYEDEKKQLQDKIDLLNGNKNAIIDQRKALEDYQARQKEAADAAQAAADAEARIAPMMKERNKLDLEYKKTLGEIQASLKSGDITSEQSKTKELDAIDKLISGYAGLIEKYTDTLGVMPETTKMLNDDIEKRKQLANAINLEKAAIDQNNDAKIEERNQTAAYFKGYNDIDHAIIEITKSMVDQKKTFDDSKKTEKQKLEDERNKWLEYAGALELTGHDTTDLKKKIKELFDDMENDDTLKNQKTMWEDIKDSAFSVISSIVDIYTASLNKQLEALKETNAQALKDFEATQKAETDAFDKSQKAQTEALEKAHTDATELLDADYKHKQELIEYDGLTYAQYLQKQVDDAIAAGDSEAEADAEKKLKLYNLQVQHDADVKALAEKQAAEQKALEQKQADDKAALEQKQADDKTALEKKQAYDSAQIQYKADMAKYYENQINAAASGAMAIINAMTISPIAAAAMGIAVAFQIAAIAAAKPAEPKFATGGIVLGSSYSGDKVSARVNSGEMILNMDQQQRLFDMLNGGGAAAMGSTGTISIPISLVLDGQTVAQVVVQRINNGNVKVTKL